ncbi:MAG: nuclear transport factor 2 family protein [Flavobacteriia bacterium]|jgi:ketosteroid isomerase-like protein
MKIKILFLLILVKSSPLIAQTELDKLVDDWHLAASNAVFDSYFSKVTEDFIFLGTAPEERWTKDQFAKFSKPYFDKGKAWDFKASNRKWNFSSNGKTAWFDEDLDTWMRGCRGSGVLVKKKGKWKIAYYNLTVLIENEKMKSFIELRDAPID